MEGKAGLFQLVSELAWAAKNLRLSLVLFAHLSVQTKLVDAALVCSMTCNYGGLFVAVLVWQRVR